MPYSLTVHIDWPRRGNGERVRHGSFSPTRTSKFICHDTIDPTARQSIMNPATIPKSSMSHRFSSRVAIGQLSQWDLDPRVLGPSLHQAGRPSPRRLIRPGPNFLAVPRPAWRRASSRDVCSCQTAGADCGPATRAIHTYCGIGSSGGHWTLCSKPLRHAESRSVGIKDRLEFAASHINKASIGRRNVPSRQSSSPFWGSRK